LQFVSTTLSLEQYAGGENLISEFCIVIIKVVAPLQLVELLQVLLQLDMVYQEMQGQVLVACLLLE
jgi:hypothetical protein